MVVGDAASGKTALLTRFSKDCFPEVYTPPTVSESFLANVTVDDKHVELALWDTAAVEVYDRLRPLSYPDTYVILMCFSLMKRWNYENIERKVSQSEQSHSSQCRYAE